MQLSVVNKLYCVYSLIPFFISMKSVKFSEVSNNLNEVSFEVATTVLRNKLNIAKRSYGLSKINFSNALKDSSAVFPKLCAAEECRESKKKFEKRCSSVYVYQLHTLIN